VPQFVVDALPAHLAEFSEGPDQLVFTNSDGSPIRRNRFSETWRRAATAVGVRQGVTYHDLRHFYASLLIRHGESVKTVQARLGRATAQETLDTYGHVWPDAKDRTRTAVEAVLGSFAAAAPADANGQ
jgi:integrase